MYSLSVMASIIIVFGLFFFLSGDTESSYIDEDLSNPNNMILFYTGESIKKSQDLNNDWNIVIYVWLASGVVGTIFCYISGRSWAKKRDLTQEGKLLS